MYHDRMGWLEPTEQLLCLQAAIKHLNSRSLGPRERFDRASFAITRYKPEDYPEAMRQRVKNILNARIAVYQDSSGKDFYNFGILSRKEFNKIQKCFISIYEACLLDIGKMDRPGDSGQGRYKIAYPKSILPLVVELRDQK